MKKAKAVQEKVDALVESGMSRPEAFKKVADEYGQGISTIRSSYYSASAGAGATRRPRRRETRPDDALADARAALERSLTAIDREVETARERATEAAAEAEDLAASAETRKAAISERLAALR